MTKTALRGESCGPTRPRVSPWRLHRGSTEAGAEGPSLDRPVGPGERALAPTRASRPLPGIIRGVCRCRSFRDRDGPRQARLTPVFESRNPSSHP